MKKKIMQMEWLGNCLLPFGTKAQIHIRFLTLQCLVQMPVKVTATSALNNEVYLRRAGNQQ